MREIPHNPKEQDGPECLNCCGTTCDKQKLVSEFNTAKLRADKAETLLKELKMTKVLNVFICAPYRADDIETVRQHIINARKIAIDVAKSGCYPVCPHTNTGLFDYELYLADVKDELYLAGCLNMLRGCSAILILGETFTAGMRGEYALAKRLSIPVIRSIDNLITFKDTNCVK